ncbi:MAG: hypothetical protein QXU92_01670 [Candidatus Diapherotrites archaeon]
MGRYTVESHLNDLCVGVFIILLKINLTLLMGVKKLKEITKMVITYSVLLKKRKEKIFSLVKKSTIISYFAR